MASCCSTAGQYGGGELTGAAAAQSGLLPLAGRGHIVGSHETHSVVIHQKGKSGSTGPKWLCASILPVANQNTTVSCKAMASVFGVHAKHMVFDGPGCANPNGEALPGV